MVEVDPSMLEDERIKDAVEGRFLDSAISVREAAVDLVGKHILKSNSMALKVIYLFPSLRVSFLLWFSYLLYSLPHILKLCWRKFYFLSPFIVY